MNNQKQPFVLAMALAAGFLAADGSGANADTPTLRRGIQNVLLIVSDDLRADVLGCYGDNLTRTPNLDDLASQSVVFDAAYCQATWCAPSRRSFMRSQYVDDGEETIGQVLRKAGSRSIRVGKIFHMRVPGDIVAGTDGNDVKACWDESYNSSGQEAHTPGAYACLNQDDFRTSLADRQSTKMPHRPFVTVQVDDDGRRQPDFKTATQAIECLRQNQDHPFFLAVGMVRPHYPMVAPRSMFEHYPFEKMPLPLSRTNDLDDIPKAGQPGSMGHRNGISEFPDNQRRMWSGYRASVEFMDQQVGRVLFELKSLGLDDKTLVIFTSDHGYHLGEHTFWQKTNLHEAVARVPLIVRAPRVKPSRSSSLVELVDVMPTVLESVDAPVPDSVQGKSLWSILDDPTAKVRESALAIDGKGNRKHYLLRTNQWAYFSYHDGSSELYDMETDPNQFENLADDSRYASILADLAERLRQRVEQI